MSQHEQVRAWDKYNEREKSKHVINGSMVYAETAFFVMCMCCLPGKLRHTLFTNTPIPS